MPPKPSEILWNRSFLGLILSQFLAAFNDQATHIVAIFFASDVLVRYVGVSYLSEKHVIMIVTACFITPFLIFSPLAGPIADRYSKRNILVAWKLAEVAIMALVLCGFLLLHCASWNILSPKALGVSSALLAILGVFLMGTHSAFFVPAKYGAMPEILHHSILSRGNGLLEGTSFTANILGTVFGGVLYGKLKSDLKNGELLPGNEWLIGGILLALAIVGAIGSFLIERLPPASPDKKPSFMSNFRVLAKSRSLMVAVAGIAFFAFMTLFMRQVLLAKGEAEKELNQQIADQKRTASLSKLLTIKTASSNENSSNGHDPSSNVTGPASDAADDDVGGLAGLVTSATEHDSTELKVAILIGLVGLGVGIGCAMAGVLSGKKLELGLVLIGALLLVVTTAALAISVRSPKTENSMLVCLILIGVAAGIYIVPMYTMLQHRAPKGSKGNLVAMSNFINVAGGLLAIIVFYGMTGVLEHFFHLNIQTAQVKDHPELREEFIQQLANAPTVASVQFLGASVITVGMIFLLLKVRPDFLVRTLFWTRMFGRNQVNPDGLHHLPEFGSLLLVTNDASADDCLQIATLTDRFGRFLTFQTEGGGADHSSETAHLGVVRKVARKFGIILTVRDPSNAEEISAAQAVVANALRQGHVCAVSISPDERTRTAAWKLIEQIEREFATNVCPVYLHHDSEASKGPEKSSRLHSLTTGEVLPPGTPIQAIREALENNPHAAQ